MCKGDRIVLEVVAQETWEAHGEMITKFKVVYPIFPQDKDVTFWEYTGGDDLVVGDRYRVCLERIDPVGN